VRRRREQWRKYVEARRSRHLKFIDETWTKGNIARCRAGTRAAPSAKLRLAGGRHHRSAAWRALMFDVKKLPVLSVGRTAKIAAAVSNITLKIIGGEITSCSVQSRGEG
jgi:hypothetical protein